MELVMKRIGILIISLLSWQLCTTSAQAGTKIYACPIVDASQYGKSYIIDKKSGQRWDLTWKQKNQPQWQLVSIPQKTVCGTHRINGVALTYQCVKFQCESAAALATLGDSGHIQCYSSYVSTDKTFYCNDSPA